MAALMDTRILLRKVRDLRCFTPRRNRVKAKWAGTLPKYPATNLTLQHLDAAYGLQLGRRWPSVRAAMLCEQKYGALVNRFSSPAPESEGLSAGLRAQGCVDFVSRPAALGLVGAGETGLWETADGRPGEEEEEEEALPWEPGTGGGAGEELQTPPPLRLSPNIQCFVFPRGDITRFKPARLGECGLLGYYLMDAASVLPALALDVQEGHSVLDLCAAPGGKTLALLQTRAIRFLCVNDSSESRAARLRSVLHSYVPRELLSDQRLRITSLDGRMWGEFESNTFDRVLVDVPCTTDRHSVTEEENNIFKRARTKERQRLPQLQMELLLAGIRAVRPGGEVVYSTCSLSRLQNQFVVQEAVRRAGEELDVGLEVVDLRPLARLYGDTFRFAPDDAPPGQLVLPHLAANFGPIYLCKLRRLS